MNIRDMGGRFWLDAAGSGLFMNTVMNLRFSWKAGNFLTSWVNVSFSRRTHLPHGVTTAELEGLKRVLLKDRCVNSAMTITQKRSVFTHLTAETVSSERSRR